jgi:hypothetical protein
VTLGAVRVPAARALLGLRAEPLAAIAVLLDLLDEASSISARL